jgi:hypothetical protein
VDRELAQNEVNLLFSGTFGIKGETMYYELSPLCFPETSSSVLKSWKVRRTHKEIVLQ